MTKLTLTAILFAALGSTALGEQAVPLHVAIQRGLVNVTVNGRGSSTGDAVQVTVQRKTARPLLVEVAAGTVIESTSADVQSMALGGVKYERVGNGYRKAAAIQLNDDKQHVYILEGYCRDFKKPTPKSQNTFNVAAPDPADTAILVHAKQVGATAKLTQVAIWIQRDGVSDKELQDSFPVTKEEVQAARQLLVSVERPELTVQVQALLSGLRERLAARNAARDSKSRKNRKKGKPRPVVELLRNAVAEVDLEVFDKVQVSIGN